MEDKDMSVCVSTRGDAVQFTVTPGSGRRDVALRDAGILVGAMVSQVVPIGAIVVVRWPEGGTKLFTATAHRERRHGSMPWVADQDESVWHGRLWFGSNSEEQRND
jgi:hypothetical protein